MTTRTNTPSGMLMALCFASAACSGADATPAETAAILAPPPEGEGFQIAMEVTAPPSTEIWKCKIAALPATQGLFAANEVSSKQNDAMHHMDIMALALTPIDYAPGEYDCQEIYDNNPVLMEEGIFLYASQQGEQHITLPSGTAAMIPSEMLYMQEVHYVNTKPEPVDVFAYVNVHTIAQEAVTDSIWGSVVRDAHINIPPSSAHTEWSRCVMNEDVDVIFVSSHTHQLGKKVTVRRYDGDEVGEQIYENTDWHAPYLKDYTPTLNVKAGEGFEFACDFDNPGSETVNWGFDAADEMCQIGLVFTPSSSTAQCEVVETSDGVIDTSGSG